MKLYKKLFSYIPERKLHGILACLLTTLGIVLEFYAYYLIWILLKNVFTGGVLSEERSLAIKILFLFIMFLFD